MLDFAIQALENVVAGILLIIIEKMMDQDK
ncbi:hypothetical protein RsY01_1493 [Lactococcus reticulitermitis]|uniref:Uncharacterized protein n=1 Tax=Pseudolactococcus reticulitermitis TaxID=2025039 RepID=A0A224X0Y3_9LACT|nr:hypothetical protein RsY01_1493 [Lactococcus reticulitermitis]